LGQIQKMNYRLKQATSCRALAAKGFSMIFLCEGAREIIIAEKEALDDYSLILASVAHSLSVK
jgi:hypothetical protein